MLTEQAARSPDASAIAAPGRKGLTYGRLLSHVGATVEALNAAGLGRNDRVALVLPNGPQMATAFLGVAAGACCAPLNPAYRAEEFEHYLTDLRAAALVVQDGAESPAVEVARAKGIEVIRLVPSLDEVGLFRLAGAAHGQARRPGFAGPQDEALVLHTSGTTSRPKIVPLTHANICVSAQNTIASLQLGPDDRALNVMPLFHIHGLVAAVLSSLASGGSVFCTPGFDAALFPEWLRTSEATWYTAVPTMHQAILAHAKGPVEGAALRFIRSCSSALPPKMMMHLEQSFGVPLVEAYGMTEASHQIACNPLPPRARKPGSVGVAVGPEVGIMDEAGRLLPAGERGEIVIRGPNVVRGYENNPAANEKSFTAGWFRTGDEGHLDSEGYLYITGRLKEMINRGGEKVSPREVDEVLLDHPAVAQAVTFAVPHPALGEDVAAAVVLREGVYATGSEIRDYAAVHLTAVKVPRQVVIVPEIPKGPTGKLQRIGLAERLGRLLQVEYVAPRSPVEALLAQIWSDLLKAKRVGANDDFFALGGSSLLAAEMLTRAGSALQVDLPFDVLFRASTVSGLAAAIQQRQAARSGGAPTGASDKGWPCVLPVQPYGSRPPLFMATLGLGWEVQDLSAHLGPDQPVYGLRPAPSALVWGRRVDARALAAQLLVEVRSVRPKGPYVLGGGCAAGIVAFEMAQQLRAQGESVPLLALFDVHYPPPRFIPAPLAGVVLRLPRTLSRFRSLGVAQKWAYVRRVATSLAKGSGAALTGKPAAGSVPARRVTSPPEGAGLAFFEPGEESLWRYRPQPYRGRMALFLAQQTARWPFHDDRLGWRQVAAGGYHVFTVPGDHQGSLREPHVRAVAEKLRTCLAAARSRGPGV
jgi:acyl-CoA synthetase (AMP-forming)/AMP-acid ligase II/thioesterase domain-containing protein